MLSPIRESWAELFISPHPRQPNARRAQRVARPHPIQHGDMGTEQMITDLIGVPADYSAILRRAMD
jgi:hypothetical protein